MAEISSVKNNSNIFTDENSFKEKTNSSQKNRKYSINSSKSDSFFSNINAEIKSFIENDADLSFSSNSNSDSQEQQINIEYLLDSKYWRTNKDLNSEIENPSKIHKKLLNENAKENIKEYEPKGNYIKNQLMVSVGSNKQSTQSNEDEETRIEHLQNISDSESNNSPLNSLSNNESDENEINCDKLSNNEVTENVEKQNYNLEIKNANTNIFGKDLLANRYNANNGVLIYKNKNEFGFPIEPINYIQNQNKKDNTMFFQGAFPNQPLCPFNANYNLPSPLSRTSISSYNNNNSSKINYIFSENKNEEYNKKENKLDINGQVNKFMNLKVNEYNQKFNQSQKEIIDLPLIINQNNNQNIPMNYNSSKLNLNLTYYPKIQSTNISNKLSLDKINDNSNYLPELNNRGILSEKKIIDNNSNYEDKNNSTNNSNSYNNIVYNNKLKLNYKNIVTNKNMNNMTNKGTLKGEKQVLNLEDIVSGKDTRTTVMIRNIPIKYTDEILNDTLVEFHGKYDCLYMPYDYEKNGNKGYAFINFTNPLHILYFYEKFNGKKWVHFESSKICELNCAHFQGINEIQKHAKNFKDWNKTNFCSEKEENFIIPLKYLFKLKKRFPKMQYTENRPKKIFIIKSFE